MFVLNHLDDNCSFQHKMRSFFHSQGVTLTSSCCIHYQCSHSGATADCYSLDTLDNPWLPRFASALVLFLAENSPHRAIETLIAFAMYFVPVTPSAVSQYNLCLYLRLFNQLGFSVGATRRCCNATFPFTWSICVVATPNLSTYFTSQFAVSFCSLNAEKGFKKSRFC